MSTLPEPRILKFTRWLNETRGLQFDATTVEGYDAMWRWSVSDLEAFWGAIWDYFAIESPTRHERVLAEAVMPGARWFEGAQVNYARQVLRHADAAHAAGHPAIVFQNERMRERGEMQHLSWPDLRRRSSLLGADRIGMPLYGIIAGLGVGGLAVALATQPESVPRKVNAPMKRWKSRGPQPTPLRRGSMARSPKAAYVDPPSGRPMPYSCGNVGGSGGAKSGM